MKIIVEEGKGRQPESAAVRVDYRLFITTLIFAAELAAGILTPSLSLVCLALLGGVDLLKALLRIFDSNRSKSPPPGKTYFGFARWPAVVGITAAILFILAGGFMFRTAGTWLEESAAPGNYYPAVAVLTLGLIASFFLTAGAARSATATFPRLGNMVARARILLSLAVLAVLLIVQFGRYQSLDPVISIFLTLFLLWKSLQLILEHVKELLDNRLPRYEEEWIEGIIRKLSGEQFRLHDLQARKRSGNRLIDFHLAVSDATPVDEAFKLANELERELIKKIPGAIVIIHVDV